MPKYIIDNFDGGIKYKDRKLQTNQFNIGEKVNIFQNEGYMMPSSAVVDIDDSSSILRGLIVAGAVDSINNISYYLTTNGDLYQLATSHTLWNDNFDGSNHAYRAITSFDTTYGGVGFNDMIFYDVSGTRKLFYSYNTANHAYIGTFDLSSTFADTAVDLGTDATSFIAPHPMIEWNTILWVGNGRYLAKYVGATNTVTANKLDLGVGWQITALFTTNNYIGVCAWKKGATNGLTTTQSKVFFWDGDSSTITYSIDIEDNKINAAINFNGRVYLSVFGRTSDYGYIGVLTENGLQIIHKLSLLVNGTLVSVTANGFGAFTIAQNKLLFGVNNRSAVLSVGDGYRNIDILTFPLLMSTTASDQVAFVKQITSGAVMVGWRTNAGAFYLYKYTPTGSTYGTATYKGGYVDVGQKIRINYIKAYFKTLVTSDSLTLGIDTDYGTSNTLGIGTGNISYTKDGAVTYKKFVKQINCHAFRPTIVWAAGGTQVSKIVIDYDYISD